MYLSKLSFKQKLDDNWYDMEGYVKIALEKQGPAVAKLGPAVAILDRELKDLKIAHDKQIEAISNEISPLKNDIANHLSNIERFSEKLSKLENDLIMSTVE